MRSKGESVFSTIETITYLTDFLLLSLLQLLVKDLKAYIEQNSLPIDLKARKDVLIEMLRVSRAFDQNPQCISLLIFLVL